MSVPFKYSSDLLTRKDQPCPCLKKFTPKDVIGFRFLEGKSADQSDFVPNGIKKSQNSKENRCTHLALSFFNSLASARKKFEELALKYDINSRYSSIGELQLNQSDGIMNNPNVSGHFELHEYQNTNLLSRKIEIHSLVSEEKNA
ncbi:hypothetical protein [Leptospira bandrabouensis]|uniref:Uncharacterized protein n=1 Tax=Leptospira bandrabouensis TaxID=2484903 RepID=A0A6H3NK91_9LEPT|nr:hypothetical protein [Leptospira bandrabouensis]TGN11615.1 hypothetical protein EHR08_17130 [Leptospira bandrabouensis]